MMTKSRELPSSAFSYLFRLLITTIFIIGLLPVPIPVQAAPGQLDHFEFSFIENQAEGTPFPITITAKDSENATVTTYNGTNTLSDGTGTISPSQTN